MADDLHFCPCCGFNFKADKEIVDGKWTVSPSISLRDGIPVALTKQESAALYAVAAAKGRPVSVEVIGNRISDGEDHEGLARVVIHRIHRKLAANCPIKNVWGRGYVWIGEAA